MKTSSQIKLACIFLNLLLMLNVTQSGAQTVYNLNVDNGLPSNYVYCLLYDTYGYLWIATKKGVVRYNGYETLLFNYTNGLPEEDVWRLYEDKRKRIWLSSISRQIGYIHNNKYKPVVNLAQKNLYPHEMKEYGNGIFFISPYQDESSHNPVLYVEKNDTLYCKTLHQSFNQSAARDGGDILVNREDSLFTMHPDFDKNNNKVNAKLLFKRQYNHISSGSMLWIGDRAMFAYKNNSFIYAASLTDTTDKVLDFPKTIKNEYVLMLFSADDNYYGRNIPTVLSNKSVYSINSALQLKKLAATDSITGQAEMPVASYYIQNNRWNQCLSTFGKGVYIHYPFYDQLKKLPGNPLSDFIYIGRTPGEDCYWWNNNTHTLAQVKSNGAIHYNQYKDLAAVEDIASYNKDTSILISRKIVYLLDNRTLQIRNILERFDHAFEDKVPIPKSAEWDAFGVLVMNPHKLYILSKARGLCDFSFHSDSAFVSTINKDRYNDMVFDSTRQALCLYNADDIEIYRDNRKIYSLGHAALRSLGIRNIEKIIIDGYGNIFLKEYNRLLLFNTSTYKYRTLFHNYMMDGVSMNIYQNTLVLAGKFGLMFSKIKGRSNVSKEIIYHNIKNTLYNYIQDIQVANSKVVLSTDKGMYQADIPDEAAFEMRSKGNNIKFTLIASYADSLYTLSAGTSINMDQKDPKLDIDVINPAGNGKVIYQYFVKETDTSWHESNNGNVVLSRLQPGKNYTLLVRVHDDILKSDPISVRLYIVPYWWQRPLWQNIFWASGLALLLIFGYSVAYITRKRVIKNTAEKNLLLELELKAVYSQINPHFIYNTLNSALLLINNEKMEEAYTHVSKFSRLLRAYVKSSRNKYTTVGEEITNLKNYIELQQTRFKNKFNYHIIIDGNSEIANIKIPSLLLQPFVENAINHGLVPCEDTGNLMIRFEKISENELTCTIEDDGIGRKMSNAFKESRLTESYGDQLIKDLVRIFNTYEKVHIEIQYIDKVVPQTGTIVKIHIKNL